MGCLLQENELVVSRPSRDQMVYLLIEKQCAHANFLRP